MKKLILICAILFPAYLNAQWSLKYAHADNEHRIAVINEDTVIAVTNWGGRIHRTTDGGQSWQFTQTIFETSWFNDVHFPSSNVGYACGGTAFGAHSNFIAKTTDGGVTWDSLTSNAFQNSYNFGNVYFVNDTVGFITGENNFLLKTTDGGLTLNVQPSLPYSSYQIRDIEFTTENVGYFSVTESLAGSWTDKVYRMLKTEDQGLSWTEVYADTMNGIDGHNHREIVEIEFVNANFGFAVGGNGIFLKTEDAGMTWETSFLSPYTTLSTVDFVNENIGYTNIAGIIHKTTNGGDTWHAQQMQPVSLVYDIEMFDEDIGYAACETGMYKTETGGDIVGQNELGLSSIKAFPNPVQNELHLLSNQSIETATFYDALGKKVSAFSNPGNTIDTSQLPSGIYTVVLQSQEESKSIKVVKF